jgi:hypothetical protein
MHLVKKGYFVSELVSMLVDKKTTMDAHDLEVHVPKVFLTMILEKSQALVHGPMHFFKRFCIQRRVADHMIPSPEGKEERIRPNVFGCQGWIHGQLQSIPFLGRMLTDKPGPEMQILGNHGVSKRKGGVESFKGLEGNVE